MKKIYFTVLILFLTSTVFATTFYVDANKSNNNGNGKSWSNAKRDLQEALDSAQNGDEIWIKSGTYYPTADPFGDKNPSNNRNKTFFCSKAVKIYGGFSGNETSLTDRNISLNQTILSGDLGSLNDKTDNAYHVFISFNSSNEDSLLLDGIIVEKGYASGLGEIFIDDIIVMQNTGAGIYFFNNNLKTRIRKCIIRENIIGILNNGSEIGGGIYFEGKEINLENSIFINNGGDSASFGGACYISCLNSSILNNVFYKNKAIFGGGAIKLEYSGSLLIQNNTFIANQLISNQSSGIAISFGTGSQSNNPTIKNNVFSSNFTNNIDTLTLHEVQTPASQNGGPYQILFEKNTIQRKYTRSLNMPSNLRIYQVNTITNIPINFFDSTNMAGADGYFFTNDDGYKINYRLEANGKDFNLYVDSSGNIDSLTVTDIENGSIYDLNVISGHLSKTKFNPCTELGTNAVIYTLIDEIGNISRDTISINVLDTIAPKISIINEGLPMNGSSVEFFASHIAAATDNLNCTNNVTLTSTRTYLDCSDLGVTPITVTATDIAGNTSSLTINTIVMDNQFPFIIVENNIVKTLKNGSASLSFEEIDIATQDNCCLYSVELSKTSFDCSNIGENVIEVSARDCAGNLSTTNILVNILADTIPTAVGKNITRKLINGSVTLNVNEVNNGSYASCSLDSISINKTSFDCSNLGSNTVILTVIDNFGHKDTTIVYVTIVDSTAPIAICKNINLDLNNGIGSINASQVNNGSYDACGGNVNLSIDKTNFTCADIGINTITLTTTDASGNISTCEAIVTVTGSVADSINFTTTELPPYCQGDYITLKANISNATSYLWNTDANTQSININSSGNYSVVIGSTSGCSKIDTFKYTYNKYSLLSNYTLLAKKKIELDKNTKLNSGGAGVVAANGKIELDNYSSITGTNTYAIAKNITTTGNSIITNTVDDSVANIILPTYFNNGKCNGACNNNSNNLKIKKDEVVTITDSIFSKIQIEKNAVVTFTASVIYAKSIETAKGVTIKFNGCTKITLCEGMELGQNNNFNPTEKQVVVYAKEDIKLEKGIDFIGSVNCKETFEVLGNNNNRDTVIGLIVAKKIKSENTTFSASNICDNCQNLFKRSNNNTLTNNKESFRNESFYLNIYPNPSNGIFNLNINADTSGLLKVSIYNAMGQKIEEIDFPDFNGLLDTKIDLNIQPNGMYFIVYRIGDFSDVRIIQVLKN